MTRSGASTGRHVKHLMALLRVRRRCAPRQRSLAFIACFAERALPLSLICADILTDDACVCLCSLCACLFPSPPLHAICAYFKIPSPLHKRRRARLYRFRNNRSPLHAPPAFDWHFEYCLASRGLSAPRNLNLH